MSLPDMSLEQPDRPRSRDGLRITAIMVLACLAVFGCDTSPSVHIVNRTTDQAKLAKFAVHARDPEVRRAAVWKLADLALVGKIAIKDVNRDVRNAAAGMLIDPTVLRRVAIEDADVGVRLTAVWRLADQETLGRIAIESKEPKVGVAAVGKLTKQEVLERITIEATDREVRGAAIRKLTDLNIGVWAKADLVPQVADHTLLIRIAIDALVPDVRLAAARTLPLEQQMEEVARLASSKDVQKYVLMRLNNRVSLRRLASDAVAPSMRLAAGFKAGTFSFAQVFAEASATGVAPQLLSDAVAAIALIPTERLDADHVRLAIVTTIRRGDVSRIADMVDLLEIYGDRSLAEDYLNCGKEELRNAGEEWARRRGLVVNIGGRSTPHVSWGRH